MGSIHRVVVTSCASHARFGVDDGTREKDGETTADDERRAREEGCAAREAAAEDLPRRVCPPGRGERAVTERDGVTKGGTRMRWNGTYTFSSLPRRCFAEEGAYRHGAHGNAQAPSAEDPRPFDEYPVSLAFSLSSLSHPTPYHAPLLSLALPPSRPSALSPSVYPPVCLSSSSSFLIRPCNHPHGRLLSVIRTKHPIGRV